MAMVNCKECGKNISDTAKVCIHCGAKTETAKAKSKKAKVYIIVSIIIILIIASIILININSPINLYKKEAKQIVNQYLNKDITADEASKEITSLRNEVKEKYNDTNDVKYLSLSSALNNIDVSLTVGDRQAVKEKLNDL